MVATGATHRMRQILTIWMTKSITTFIIGNIRLLQHVLYVCVLLIIGKVAYL